jgi:pro-sigmaK processing inhibitor BofA
MKKVLLTVIKRIVFGFVILYGYNLIATSFNMTIPINIVTLLLISVLGAPALFALIMLLLVVY